MCVGTKLQLRFILIEFWERLDVGVRGWDGNDDDVGVLLLLNEGRRWSTMVGSELLSLNDSKLSSNGAETNDGKS